MVKEILLKEIFAKGLEGFLNIFKKIMKKAPLSLYEVKKRTQILFIDDEPFDFLLENIRQAGWSVKQTKEVVNLDSEDLRNSDIIFVDYRGVGITVLVGLICNISLGRTC